VPGRNGRVVESGDDKIDRSSRGARSFQVARDAGGILRRGGSVANVAGRRRC